jgi:hypothetical protein
MPSPTFGKRDARQPTRPMVGPASASLVAAPTTAGPRAESMALGDLKKWAAIICVGVFVTALAIARIASAVAEQRQPQVPRGAVRHSVAPPADLSAGDSVVTAQGLPSWAKLYPGATDVTTEPPTDISQGRWRIHYTVQAPLDQVVAFYSGIASNAGFTEQADNFSATVNTTGSGLVYHKFQQPDSRNDLSYVAGTDPRGTRVTLDARSDGATAGSGK